MQTRLTYRIPGKEIVEIKGVFKLLNEPENFEGFIVSDFEGKNNYGFYENETGEEKRLFEVPTVLIKPSYCDLAHKFIHYLQDYSIDKAILSRIKKVEFDETKRLKLFQRLCENYPQSFCYTFDSPLIGKWIGATPETLLSINEETGYTMSLAGTKPVDDNSDWGEKEIHEQQLVTGFIHTTLEKNCTNIKVSERKELNAGPVKHLVHSFSFNINQKNYWNLIQDLHPTPAVSGFPRKDALRCIENFEPHNRHLYAGIIGIKAKNNVKLYVNLRCAELLNNQLFLYLGGGLTQQSIPELEWEETENKAKTLLNLASF